MNVPILLCVTLAAIATAVLVGVFALDSHDRECEWDLVGRAAIAVLIAISQPPCRRAPASNS